MSDDERADKLALLMRRINERSLNAAKLTWSALHLMARRPNERDAILVLAQEINAYVCDTATMANTLLSLTGDGADDGH